MMYSEALESGILPLEFWEMSIQEVRDTVNSRMRQKQNEIYTLSGMIRVAVLSVFSDKCKFPVSPDEAFDRNQTDYSKGNLENWKNSYNYLKALQKVHKGGA